MNLFYDNMFESDGIIKSKLSSVSFDTWFKDTKISSITEDTIYIEVPMSFHKDFLNKNGLLIFEDNITVSEWLQRWFVVYKGQSTYNTWKMYHNSIYKHIIPTIGHFKLTQLKTSHIQIELNELLEQGIILKDTREGVKWERA